MAKEMMKLLVDEDYLEEIDSLLNEAGLEHDFDNADRLVINREDILDVREIFEFNDIEFEEA